MGFRAPCYVLLHVPGELAIADAQALLQAGIDRVELVSSGNRFGDLRFLREERHSARPARCLFWRRCH